MPKKIFRDISASTFQVATNQLLGLGIFFILSKQLSKPAFGDLNFVVATLTVFWGFAGLGIDLIAVKRIAAGEEPRPVTGVHIVHSLVSSILLMLLFFLVVLFLPGKKMDHGIVFKLCFSLCLTYLSVPFKQLAYGKRMFFMLAAMSIAGACSRFVLLVVVSELDILNLNSVAWVFVISSLAELLVSLVLVLKRFSILPVTWSWEKYRSVASESLPQFWATILNSVMARFDWIFLGLISTSLATADYVFAYKIFEISKLPLWIISPVLLPVFTGFFSRPQMADRKKRVRSKLLFAGEILVSALIPMVIAIVWLPLMNHFYAGKYGAPSLQIFLVLSLCVPLQFATDYYWNLCVAQGQLKLTTRIFFLSTLLNIALNVCLIPFFGGIGAAFSFFGSYALQLLMYRKYTQQEQIKPEILSLFKTIACASASLALCLNFVSNVYLAVPLVVMLYFGFCIMTKSLVLKKLKTFVNVMVR